MQTSQQTMDSVDPTLVVIGTPKYFYEFAGTVGFKPVPSAAFISGGYTLEVTYAASVGNWTSGESVLPESTQLLLLQPAYLKAMLREHRWQEATTAFTAWFEQIQLAPGLTAQPATGRSDLKLAKTPEERLRRRTA